MPKKTVKKKPTKKHKWITYEGSKNIDIFAAENLGSKYHNGPKCSVCGFEFCQHCYPGGFKTKCGAKSLGSDDNKLNGFAVSLSDSLRSSLKN